MLLIILVIQVITVQTIAHEDMRLHLDLEVSIFYTLTTQVGRDLGTSSTCNHPAPILLFLRKIALNIHFNRHFVEHDVCIVVL